MTSTQLVVVGGGPGGYAAAFLAADLGLTTTLVDPEPNPGGVCVYRGCIPSKALLHVAKLVDESRHAKAWGVEFGEPKIDLDKLRAFKDNVVKRLTSGTSQLVKFRKVRYLQGYAEIVDAHNLRVKLAGGGEEAVQFEHAILAKRVRQTMKSVLLETKVVEMKPEAKGVRVAFAGNADQKEQLFDRVLVSVGRRPNSKIPGLEKTHVQVDRRGFIMVDEQRRTHESSIFAIGDVVGEPMLAHKASHEGRVAVEVMAGENVAFAPRAIPAVVFTDPELAWCGLTETQATKEGRHVTVGKCPGGASGRAMPLDRTDGLTKLILDPDTERLLGVGLVGPGAGELIAEGVLGIEMGANATDLKLTIHPHPTLTETLMESAEVFFGQATHVFRPKRG